MDLRTFILVTAKSAAWGRRPPIHCKDGANLSVQASENHLCKPKGDFLSGYTHYEVEAPKPEPPEEWDKYAEYEYAPSSFVYGYVPAEIIEAYIDSHGGIDAEKVMQYYYPEGK